MGLSCEARCRYYAGQRWEPLNHSRWTMPSGILWYRIGIRYRWTGIGTSGADSSICSSLWWLRPLMPLDHRYHWSTWPYDSPRKSSEFAVAPWQRMKRHRGGVMRPQRRNWQKAADSSITATRWQGQQNFERMLRSRPCASLCLCQPSPGWKSPVVSRTSHQCCPRSLGWALVWARAHLLWSRLLRSLHLQHFPLLTTAT